MVATIEYRKVKLIAFIAALQQEETIHALENTIEQFKSAQPRNGLTTVSKAELNHFQRPIRENITVEDLVLEQNWQRSDENKMDAKSSFK